MVYAYVPIWSNLVNSIWKPIKDLLFLIKKLTLGFFSIPMARNQAAAGMAQMIRISINGAKKIDVLHYHKVLIINETVKEYG